MGYRSGGHRTKQIFMQYRDLVAFWLAKLQLWRLHPFPNIRQLLPISFNVF